MSNRWPKVRLGELLSLQRRDTLVEPHVVYDLLGAHWYATGLYTKETKPGAQIKAERLYRVEKGDFVYNRLFAWKGSFAVATDANHGCYVSNEFPCFQVDETRLDAQYLWWYFSRELAWTEALGLSHGATPTSRNRLKEDRLLHMEIPLPPLPEQRRIVAKIEDLAAKIEEASTVRDAAATETEKLVASYANQLFGEDRRKKCSTRTLGEISEIRSGVTLGRQLHGPTISLPYLRVANVQDGYLDLSVVKTVSILEDEREKWQLQDGDLLVTEGGDWDKLGRGTLWHGEIPDCIHQNHIFRVRLIHPEFDPCYVLSLTRSPYGKEYFQNASKQTTNLASINQQQLKAFPVYQLPLIEQRRIVSSLDHLQSRIHRIRESQNRTAAELDALLPSILDKAFKGEL